MFTGLIVLAIPLLAIAATLFISALSKSAFVIIAAIVEFKEFNEVIHEVTIRPGEAHTLSSISELKVEEGKLKEKLFNLKGNTTMAKGYSARGGFGHSGGAASKQQQLQMQVAKMQQEMANAQAAVEESEFTASVGGGVVTVTVSGKKEVVSVKISPEAVDPDDVEMLEDLIVAATNEALRKMEEESSKGMGNIAGGLGGLGGGFPF